MPAPGDQHTSIANPFQEPQQRISEYTAKEIATLQSRLEKQLGPEYISSRAGPSGQKVHYITAEKCITLANEVFGFNGWSSSIQNIQVDFVDENPQTLKISLGLSVIVRVTLRDGTYHEDLGYGHIENCKGKAAAFEKAKKEGTTDALKRALRHFGNVLGNCIYDKAYLAKVTKIKVAPSKFDENCLHRHPGFVVKKEVTESDASKSDNAAPPPLELPSVDLFEDFLGELDEADFNISEEGHPDEIVLPNSVHADSNRSNLNSKSHEQTGNSGNSSMQPPARPLVRAGSTGSIPPRQPPQTPNQQSVRPNANPYPGAQNHVPPSGPRPPQQFNQNRAPAQPTTSNTNPQTHLTPPSAAGNNPDGGGETGGFFSARAVSQLPEKSLKEGKVAPKAGQVFNPRLESPSIRKTPGIDHTKSKPVARNGQHVPPAGHHSDDGHGPGANNSGAGGARPTNIGSAPGLGGQPAVPRPVVAGSGPPLARGNMVNPQLDQTRRIGAPGSSSPLANRGQYKPPTMMKRPAADGPAASVEGRPPLSDKPSNVPVNGNGGAPEAKRQKTS
ncbi:DNA repair protein rad52 [Madurella fahalii]|uniref:DNA repair protein rad52 n=1 Tax=Madurella fahalii TaxID=1157608 RepID=A0ABQ0GBN8_9PEZI